MATPRSTRSPVGPTARLAATGRTLPLVAPSVANYVPAVRIGRFALTSGQLPFVDGKLAAVGKVGAEVGIDDATELTRISALNALAAVDALVGLDAIARIVRVGGFIASAPDFTRQAEVLNGASNLLGEIFGEAGVHVRSAVGVAVLPLDAPVEVEIMVEVLPDGMTDGPHGTGR